MAADPSVALSSSEAPLVDAFDVALLDLDGVVYVGGRAVPHAVEVLAAARQAGMRLAFVTNNASRTPEQVAAHLCQLGVSSRPEEVVTSSQAAAHVLADRLPSGARVLVVGGEGLAEAVRERGLVPVTSADDDPAAVVQGYGPKVGWAELAEATYAVDRGALWVATNTDSTIPTARGRAPGNGALVGAVRLATGREPLVTGKPEVPMHREAVERSAARSPLVVGDRLDTDIEGARRGGVPSLLVLTGISDATDLVLAPAGRRPDFVALDLRGLLLRHPDVRSPANGSGTCRNWEAHVTGGRLRLSGPREPADEAERLGHEGTDGLDALRATCAAVWTASEDRRPSPRDVSEALHGVGLATRR